VGLGNSLLNRLVSAKLAAESSGFSPYYFKKGMVCQFKNGMVSLTATSEAGGHAAGDTKSEHFEPARVRKLNEKQFSH
jgi:hypothetical protein